MPNIIRTGGGMVNTTPDGATAIPIDDYVIWIRCAGINPSGYANLASVIADTETAMPTLCNNLNALRYMLRSTSTILPAVLANSTWTSALGSSTYGTKVPTMTSETAPSGQVIKSSQRGTQWAAWKAFDKNEEGDPWESGAVPTVSVPQFIGYMFTLPVAIYKFYANFWSSWAPKDYKIQYSDDNVTYTDVYSETFATTNSGVVNSNGKSVFSRTLPYVGEHKYWRLIATSQYGSFDMAIWELQFYGLDI